MESGDKATAETIVFDYRKANLTQQQKSLCDYAVKLTQTPGQVNDDDIGNLRQAGCDEPQITIATQVIGFFNLINRIAEGLGVDPEPWMEIPEAQWKQEKGVF